MTIYLLLYAHEPGMGAEMGGVRKVLELARELKKNGHHAVAFAPAFLSVPDDPEVPEDRRREVGRFFVLFNIRYD